MGGLPRAVLLRAIDGGGGLPLVPGLTGPRTARMAWAAPKLMRRAKGGMGAVRAPSSSSIAFSSSESELVERLARRRRAEGVVGEVPDRPMVVTETLRRWSAMAGGTRCVGGRFAVGVGCEIELVLNKLAKGPEVMDPRLCCRAMSFGLAVELPLSEDMATESGRDGKACDGGVDL